MIDGTIPAHSELEVSVFGPGFGEAICLHVNGDWVLVDSCLNPDSEEPAALSYLRSIGVDPRNSVCLLVVTHWDDDHTNGIGQIVEQCERATVACSLALARKEIVQFVIEQERVRSGALGSGLDGLRTILTRCRSTGRLTWAKATVALHPRASGDPTVVALSPSDDAVARSIESLIQWATHANISHPRRYRAPDGPNRASVAATVRAGRTSILLGADLENSENPLTGWDAVLAYARPDISASIVKVPHHGSEGAHHAGVWDQIVDDTAIAIVTPWVRGGGRLPTEHDLTRLRGVADRVYLTATPELRAVTKSSEVEKLIRTVADVKLEELKGWGQVRARRRRDEATWRVDLDGDARLIE